MVSPEATVLFKGDPTEDGMAVLTSFGVNFELSLEMVGKPLRIASIFQLLSSCCGADLWTNETACRCMKCRQSHAIKAPAGGVMDPERLLPALEHYANSAAPELDPIHRVLLIREAIRVAEERAYGGGPYKKLTVPLVLNHG